jgi:diaminopimelate decarboxylase
MTPPAGTADALRAVAARFGTPAYAYDLAALRSRVRALCAALPAGVEVLYSVKANPSLGLCEVLAGHELGAEVSSIGELLLARRAGFATGRIMVSGPHKGPHLVDRLRDGMLVSVDSIDELRALSEVDGLRLVLRLRPDFEPFGEMIMGPGDRFGIPLEELRPGHGGRVVGFHVYAGSQVLDGGQAAKNLAGAFELALRAAGILGVDVEFLDVGGGFGVPVGPGQSELDLGPVCDELARQRAALAPDARLAIELGRYLVGPTGYYLTSVLGTQTRDGRPAVIVDGGVHQRPDLCGLDLFRRAAAPFSLAGSHDPPVRTDVLGCLCLPGDILAEAVELPPPAAGTVLVFANAGAYGLSAAPTAFLGHPAPPEIAFDGDTMLVLRERTEPDAYLRGQHSSGGRSPAPPA